MQRRKGRDTRDWDALAEREAERSAIAERLAQARGGQGRILVIEAPAGEGKTTLLQLAGDAARSEGFLVMGAWGSELERHFPFGIAIQLFEPWWLASNDTIRRQIKTSSAAAERLLEEGPGTDEQSGYATVHALFRLTVQLAQGSDGPLVMLVDDAQWADSPSLHFLNYLAARISVLPVALIVAMRPGEPGADVDGLAALSTAGTGLRLGPLSPRAVRQLVRGAFSEADEWFCAACARITNGNPFLLHELLEQVHRDGLTPNRATADRLGDLAPDTVLEAVVARVGAMPEAVRAVAEAVAILGDGAALRHVAELAELSPRRTAQAADALAAMHLFYAGEPLSFSHPLVRQSVEQSLAPLARGDGHARAAEILDRDGRPAQLIAPHLLAAPAVANPRAVNILREAAHEALVSGAPLSAVEMLRRAMAEGVRSGRPDVLAELAEAELAADLPVAASRLEDAIRVNPRGRQRPRLSAALGAALYRQGEYRRAATVLAEALETQPDDPNCREELTARFVSAASLVPELCAQARQRGEQLLDDLAETPTAVQREAVAHLAATLALSGRPRAEVLRLVDLAWADGQLLTRECDGAWSLLCSALTVVDELELALDLGAEAQSRLRTPGNDAEPTIADAGQTWALYERGEIGAAAEAARQAVDRQPSEPPVYFRPAYTTLAYCHVRQGRLDEAEQALTIVEHSDLHDEAQRPSLLVARAQLRLAQRRAPEALADALEAGRRWERLLGTPSPAALSWRSTAALAHLALGAREQARRLASEELELARETEMTRAIIRGLRVRGLIEGGDAGLQLLSDAVEVGREHPVRLEHILALASFGAALRRANQRAGARDPLTKALELSQRGEASALADEVRAELELTGARMRTAGRWGVDALTPSERRVAELAAEGLTTREMADSLFVTPKTVEYHLRHIYQKLGVNSRDRLTGALRGES